MYASAPECANNRDDIAAISGRARAKSGGGQDICRGEIRIMPPILSANN